MVRRIYRSLPDPEAIKRGLIRVVDESGDEYLYPAAMFVAIDVPQEVEKAFKRAS